MQPTYRKFTRIKKPWQLSTFWHGGQQKKSSKGPDIQMDKQAGIQQSTVERYSEISFEKWYFQSCSRHYWKATVCTRYIAKTGENRKMFCFFPFNPFIQSLEIIRTQNIPGTGAPKCMLANFRDTHKTQRVAVVMQPTYRKFTRIKKPGQLSTVLARWILEKVQPGT